MIAQLNAQHTTYSILICTADHMLTTAPANDGVEARTSDADVLDQLLTARRLLDAAAHALMQQRVDSYHLDLRQQAQQLAALLTELSNPGSDWASMNNTRTLKTWHKQSPGQQALHSVRAAMEFPGTHVDQLLTMGWEFDLVTTWNSYATATHILQVAVIA